jgi:hypothetical protein
MKNTSFTDLIIVIRKHWKSILIFILTLYILYAYPGIKKGVIDAWAGN